MVLKTIELIQQVRRKLQTTQSWQKSYAENCRSDLEFQVGDMVLLKVSPWKGVIWFKNRGKYGHQVYRSLQGFGLGGPGSLTS